MSAPKETFRALALERLASPDQLDQRLRVTALRGWLAAAGLVSVLIAGGVWSVLGRVPHRVIGQGILVHSGGVLTVVALGSGQITELTVRPGDRVARGALVARLAQPALADELDKAKARLAELVAQEDARAALVEEGTRVRGASSDGERAAVAQALRAAEERRAWLTDKLAAQQRLYDQGLITQEALFATRSQLDAARDELDSRRGRLRELSVRQQEQRSQSSQDALSGELRVNEQRRAVALLEERLEQSARVISPHDGRVLEVRIGPGSLVAPGTPLVNLEPVGTGTDAPALEALLYLPAAGGKQVKPGMEVLVAPSTVRPERHGFVVGTVRRVDEFPATRQGMMRALENEALVNAFLESSGGAPIAAEVTLTVDRATASGYRWTSGRGPAIALDGGTLVRGEITVRTERPLALVLPLVR